MAGETVEVTLMFTDIEGSTRMWEDHPQEMAVALASHDELMRAAIESAGGGVFKTVGDAFCAAFADPSAALTAAVAAQRRLDSHAWPGAARLTVRMALHTGDCQIRDEDFFGPSVNRVARLLSTAHGGQVVLSATTAERVRSRLPDGLSLQDLGEHRLKDLSRPEVIFQVRAAGLATEFPPLRSLDDPALRHNLPIATSSFIGREAELAALRELIVTARVVTLAGSGGVGKTRLAMQAGAELLDGSADGVWLVELAPLAEGHLVASTVATALGVRLEPNRPPDEALAEALAPRRMLLILDNCEHLVEAAAKLANTIVQRCPEVVILATSREPLGITGEHILRVPSLATPEANPAGVEGVTATASVQLFAERAREHTPGFTVDATNAGTVASLCRHLDGIPLAIELAAARLRHLGIDELEKRLDQRFRVLTGGPRTSLPRQQTLRALIDWSYDLLMSHEQEVLDRLSVFAGTFDLDAAEDVATDPEGTVDVVFLVGSLVDKSLVQADESNNAIRYRLLESVREYARAKLAARPAMEADRVQRAHRDHYLELANRAAGQMNGPEQVVWFQRLSADVDNFRAATAYSLTDPDPEPGLNLASRLAYLRWWRGEMRECLDTLARHLARPESAGPTMARMGALTKYAHMLTNEGDPSAGLTVAREALEIAERADDTLAVCRILNTLVLAHRQRGEADEALAASEEQVRLARQLGDDTTLAMALGARGLALAGADLDPTEVEEESLTLWRAKGDATEVVNRLINLGYHRLQRGDLEAARGYLDEAMQSAQRLESEYPAIYAAFNRGLVACLEDDLALAQELFRTSYDAAVRIAHHWYVVYSLNGLAAIEARTGEPERAAVAYGAADAGWEQLGATMDPVEARLREADLVALRESLGETEFERLFERGRLMAMDEARRLVCGPEEALR